MKIYEAIKAKKLTQAKVAKILKISQPKVSLFLRGYLTDFSLERLLRFLNDLGQDVYISVVPSPHSHGNTWVGDSSSRASIAALGR
jgi:predicted XRE-type DNA-binding protein